MNLNVVFDVPALVAQGLMNGSLERVGGVVRDVTTKKIVMWLGEGNSKEMLQPPFMGESMNMSPLLPWLSAFGIGTSVAGFALVMKRLDDIGERISRTEKKVDRINHKLDDQLVARLRSGVNAFENALNASSGMHRSLLAHQAINAIHETR